jgi:hypothetical protein
MKNYAEALRHNNTVIAVVATHASKRREVADLLKRHGATFHKFIWHVQYRGVGIGALNRPRMRRYFSPKR